MATDGYAGVIGMIYLVRGELCLIGSLWLSGADADWQSTRKRKNEQKYETKTDMDAEMKQRK